MLCIATIIMNVLLIILCIVTRIVTLPSRVTSFFSLSDPPPSYEFDNTDSEKKAKVIMATREKMSP